MVLALLDFVSEINQNLYKKVASYLLKLAEKDESVLKNQWSVFQRKISDYDILRRILADQIETSSLILKDKILENLTSIDMAPLAPSL